MDPNRFDQLSKSIASRSTRRSALSRLGLGGLLGAAAGTGLGARARAASGDTVCQMKFHAKTATGTHKGKAYDGALSITINATGGIDSGAFDDGSGNKPSVVGQAYGRALNFRFDYQDGSVYAFQGTALNDVVKCQGDIHGTFEGPNESDLGKWNASLGAAGGANANANGAAPAATAVPTNAGAGATSTPESSGGATGGPGTDETPAPTEDPNAPDAANCPSGVMCGGVCCTPAAGFTPDSITCDGNSCSCSYSCTAASCPQTVDGAVIVATCGDAPNTQCFNSCFVDAPDTTTDTPGTGGGDAGSGGGGGNTSNCPPDLTNCDDTPCCVSFNGLATTDIECAGGQCFCTYTCAAANCANPRTDVTMVVACIEDPAGFCGDHGCL